MRPAQEIREDVERVAESIGDNRMAGELLRKQLAHLFLQTRQHPELSMAEACRIAGVSRVRAYEMVREVE